MNPPDNAARAPRRLIVNADDYAMDGAVDAAILRLAELGTVTATSAMVLSPTWDEAARKLLDAQLSCGLHLDFTSPFAGAGGGSLGSLMLRAFTRRLETGAVRASIDRQLALYDTAMGAAPGFVDGHQHVHQFPVIREALFAALAERYGVHARAIAVRSCASQRWRGVKAAIVAATGAAGFTRLARTGSHVTNTDFAGVYDFAPAAPLATLWRGWLAGLQGEAPLIMCHVAEATDDAPSDDPIRPARVNEYGWLASATYRELTAELNFELASWP